MPNRVLREGIISSELVNRLTWGAEVFYRRLHSVVDDFGRFSAHPSLLRAALYPLKLNDVSDADVGKWLTECVTGGLVSVYEVENKRFLVVLKFDQRVRAEKSKYPPPPDNCPSIGGQLTVNGQTAAPVVEGGDEGGVGTRKPRRKPATAPPDSFEVTDEMAQWAVGQGLVAERVLPETEKCLDYFRSKGESRADWVATWRTWIRKAVEYGARP